MLLALVIASAVIAVVCRAEIKQALLLADVLEKVEQLKKYRDAHHDDLSGINKDKILDRPGRYATLADELTSKLASIHTSLVDLHRSGFRVDDRLYNIYSHELRSFRNKTHEPLPDKLFRIGAKGRLGWTALVIPDEKEPAVLELARKFVALRNVLDRTHEAAKNLRDPELAVGTTTNALVNFVLGLKKESIKESLGRKARGAADAIRRDADGIAPGEASPDSDEAQAALVRLGILRRASPRWQPEHAAAMAELASIIGDMPNMLDYTLGRKGRDVRVTQAFLKEIEFYRGPVTGTFDAATHRALEAAGAEGDGVRGEGEGTTEEGHP